MQYFLNIFKKKYRWYQRHILALGSWRTRSDFANAISRRSRSNFAHRYSTIWRFQRRRRPIALRWDVFWKVFEVGPNNFWSCNTTPLSSNIVIWVPPKAKHKLKSLSYEHKYRWAQIFFWQREFNMNLSRIHLFWGSMTKERTNPVRCLIVFKNHSGVL